MERSGEGSDRGEGAKLSVLFVCTGNICRSPTAEGVFRDMVRAGGLEEAIAWDSAGTHAYHVGEPPDRRSAAAARRRGVELADLRARALRKSDFETFDLLLAMDRGHLRLMEQACPVQYRGRLALFLSFAPRLGIEDVPDPYYGGPDGFEKVLDMIEAGSAGLLAHLRGRLG